MFLSRSLAIEELLDVCLRNRLISSYQRADTHIVFIQEDSVYELTPEHAHLYLQNLIRYARGNLSPGPLFTPRDGDLSA